MRVLVVVLERTAVIPRPGTISNGDLAFVMDEPVQRPLALHRVILSQQVFAEYDLIRVR
ncbi:MAG: hypothetical protein HYU36_14610 [Planctomycetes bacterium]|nr:hypothetical protein [Planctomycetota bacterium]